MRRCQSFRPNKTISSFPRLGTVDTLNAKVAQCRAAGCEIQQDTEMVIVTDGGEVVLRAIKKDCSFWIISYHKRYWGE